MRAQHAATNAMDLHIITHESSSDFVMQKAFSARKRY